MGHRNPKSGQGDGAGFGRLRAAQAMRQNFATLLRSANNGAGVYIDQIREYAGSQIVFYRVTRDNREDAYCAVFKPTGRNGHVLSSETLVAEGD